MSEQAVIIPGQLTSEGTVFAGKVVPADLPRLADFLANGDGELEYRLHARMDARQRRVVSCIIKGFAFLTCQSTLEVFRHSVDVSERLVLVDTEEQLPAFEEEPEDEDYVVAGKKIAVLGLVEEAVILSLPMVPRKPGLDPGEVPATKERASPFAALAALKAKKD
jgi:uncharacterized protein